MKRQDMTLKVLRSFASELGVKIVAVRDDSGWGYWLEGTGWDDENFCTSRHEVYMSLCQLKNQQANK